MIFYEGKETKCFDISFTSYLLTSEVDANNRTRSPLLDLNPIYAEMFMPIEVRQYRRRRHARGKWDSYLYELDGSNKSPYFEPCS
jgi:hypothetical protein